MPYAPKYPLDRNLTMHATWIGFKEEFESTHHVPKEDTIYIILINSVFKF